jgi:hypothetical protein
LSQGATMKQMSVEIIIQRSIEEIWVFDIPNDADPQDVFEEIERNPDTLWTKYNPILYEASDLDETVTDVTRFEVE